MAKGTISTDTDLHLQRVTTNVFQGNRTQQWKESFNQATFFNYDTVNALKVLKFVLPPATTSGSNVMPSFLAINLNAGEVNETNFIVDSLNSTTANWWIIYTQYVSVP